MKKTLIVCFLLFISLSVNAFSTSNNVELNGAGWTLSPLLCEVKDWPDTNITIDIGGGTNYTDGETLTMYKGNETTTQYSTIKSVEEWKSYRNISFDINVSVDLESNRHSFHLYQNSSDLDAILQIIPGPAIRLFYNGNTSSSISISNWTHITTIINETGLYAHANNQSISMNASIDENASGNFYMRAARVNTPFNFSIDNLAIYGTSNSTGWLQENFQKTSTQSWGVFQSSYSGNVSIGVYDIFDTFKGNITSPENLSCIIPNDIKIKFILHPESYLYSWNLTTYERDTDEDGFLDKDDDCPNIGGLSTIDRQGCPDLDGDGVSDLNDPCPEDPNDECDDIIWNPEYSISWGVQVLQTLLHIASNETINIEVLSGPSYAFQSKSNNKITIRFFDLSPETTYQVQINVSNVVGGYKMENLTFTTLESWNPIVSITDQEYNTDSGHIHFNANESIDVDVDFPDEKFLERMDYSKRSYQVDFYNLTPDTNYTCTFTFTNIVGGEVIIPIQFNTEKEEISILDAIIGVDLTSGVGLFVIVFMMLIFMFIVLRRVHKR